MSDDTTTLPSWHAPVSESDAQVKELLDELDETKREPTPDERTMIMEHTVQSLIGKTDYLKQMSDLTLKLLISNPEFLKGAISAMIEELLRDGKEKK